MEILAEIRRSHCLLSLPVIMLTSEDEQGRATEMLAAGANDYFIRPLDPDLSLASVETQLKYKELASAKDEFLSFASHDLKKPVMLIQDIASELRGQLMPGMLVAAEVQQDFEYLIQAADNMMHVIEGFLNKETFDSGTVKLEKHATCINQIVEEVVRENLGYAKSKGILLRIKPANRLPEVEADRQKMREVVDNLVGNAIKFSSPRTRVRISTHLESNNVCVKVSDSGPGLSEDDLAKLFVKHATLSNKPTGHETSSGMGLHICRSLIKQHGGSIGAMNNTEGGATFWIALPVSLQVTSSSPKQLESGFGT
jgi:signal transduction histidine kinase